ncbi:chaperone protein dnaJ 6 [Zea mays]|uniref:chaperone protein dnaJ 6 n=1 Tax=Zea mays TaxID=4577 RepID=UPI0004DE9609|nr:chaperone protein dnaJ 6 [Zea mays]|eukprot:XP_008646724.1 chaperone protein dnaJ 6 [Zea mays]
MARLRPEPIDREKTCPLLLRVFTRVAGHHQNEEFAVRGKEPKDEVQIYAWKDATLRELTDLVSPFYFYRLNFDMSLRLHPDKNPGDEEAKEKFQLLQKALVGEAADNLQEYFRTMYKKVTEADIEEFEAKYRGSDSEKTDLKELYTKYKGNMNMLFCTMICSEPKLDSHRFKDIIDEAIGEGELKSTKVYEKWAKKISGMEPPTNPLERRAKKRKNSEENDLILAISQRKAERKKQFNSILSNIMSKCDSKASSSEPTEEEFEQAQQRPESRRAKRRK